MAKIVIAGRANCPYYAKVELLADSLVKNLPDFKLHKIVKEAEDWERWLEKTSAKHGWNHKKSPLIWRELINRGGKGKLIGGANEFQEYAKRYYDIKSAFTSNDMTKIASENLHTTLEVADEERLFRAQSKPLHVCITNASSSVAYTMIKDIAAGEALGQSTEVTLRLFTVEQEQDALEGVEMETFDLACPLLRDTLVTSNVHQAFSDCSVIVLLDEVLKEEDETKDNWLKRNYELFVSYAKVIDEVAKKDVKVIIAGKGPVNFNAHMMIENISSIPRQNIVALSRMTENHAKAVLASKLGVNSASVVDVIVWGNANGSHYIDISKARVHNYDGAIWGPPFYSVPVSEMIHDKKWLKEEFLDLAEKRGSRVEEVLLHQAAMSHASAVISLLKHWSTGAPSGQMFSLGVCSNGLYGVPEGLVCSLPVTFFPKGYWSLQEDVEQDELSRKNLQEAVKDLMSEREVIYPPPKPPTPPTPDVPSDPQANTESSDQNTNNSAVPSEEESGSDTGAVQQELSAEGAVFGEQAELDSASALRLIPEDREGEEAAERLLADRKEA